MSIEQARKTIRMIIGLGAGSVFILGFWLLANPWDTLREIRDSVRIQNVRNLDTMFSIFIQAFPEEINNLCSQDQPCDSSQRSQAVDGTGWIPIDFTLWQPKPMMDRLSQDPFNRDDFVIRFVTNGRGGYEFDVKLEGVVGDISAEKDHIKQGNNPDRYEVGSDLTILP